jgi:signal transduction histidine kinase
VATLVARAAPPAEIFAAVTDEVHRLLHLDLTVLRRFDPDGLSTVVAGTGMESDVVRVGERSWPPGAAPGHKEVLTGSPARIDEYTPIGTDLDDLVDAERIVAWVIAPIVLLGRVWGVLVACSRRGPLPAGAEERLADFGELVATAISNVESRAELVASRARIVAASDEARRRIQRDLHDGAQQRVVNLAIKVKLLVASDAARASGLAADLLDILTDADAALDELRDIAHGLHPPALSRGGLRPALTALARRSPIPVAVDLRVPGRLAVPVEVAAYYLVAEMLTNATKHANASRVDVEAETLDGALRVCVRDDGAGGADPAGGSGLVGLRDRVEAVGGTMTIHSPQGGGTTLIAWLPLGETTPSAPEIARA